MFELKLKSRNVLPIGLDIGHSSIKMIQLARNGAHLNAVAAQRVHFAPDRNTDGRETRSFIISAIKQMLEEGGFRGRNVVSALPDEQLKITSLRLAQTDSGEIEQAVTREVAQRFGPEVSQDAIKYTLVGNVRHGEEIKNELILFVADNESVKERIELLEEAGLRPVGIDALPCALFRSFERSLQRQEDKERTSVFIDIGSQFTTVVFGRGRDINFIKQIDIGLDSFNREVAAKLEVDIEQAEMLCGNLRAQTEASISCQAGEQICSDDTIPEQLEGDKVHRSLDASTRQMIVDAVSTVAENLAREVSLCFRYFTVTFRGRRVERAVFSGGGAYEKILLNILKRQLAVEIETAEPLRGIDMANLDFGSDRRSLLCEWAVAVGLSLKRLELSGPEQQNSVIGAGAG